MPQRRKLIFHIGTEKTGSTSLQEMLALNRARLAEQGFAFLRSPGGDSHTHLAIYAAKATATQDLCGTIPGGRERVLAELRHNVFSELSSLPDHIHTVILSNEHCHSRITSTEEIFRLKDLLDELFFESRILVYLRRQDDLAVSRYSTLMKSLVFGKKIIFPTKEEILHGGKFFYDHSILLDIWENTFGRSAIFPKVYEKSSLLEGDVVADFSEFCGIDASGFVPVPRRNESLNPIVQELFRRLSEDGASGIAAGPRSLHLLNFLKGGYTGRGREPSRASALEFYSYFEDANERVRQRYFPDREALFSADFDKYPEIEEPTSDSDVLQAALDMIGGMASEVRSLNAALAVTRGQLLLARAGERDEAVRCFEQALAYQPNNQAALWSLVELAESGMALPSLASHLRAACQSAPGHSKIWDDMDLRLRNTDAG